MLTTDKDSNVIKLSFLDSNKMLHVAFVDYFLLIKKVEQNQCGWTEEFKDEALDILDSLATKYANQFTKEGV
jgi:hypothetical protein